MVHYLPLLKFINEINKQIKIVIINSIHLYIVPNQHDFPSYVEHKKKLSLFCAMKPVELYKASCSCTIFPVFKSKCGVRNRTSRCRSQISSAYSN